MPEWKNNIAKITIPTPFAVGDVNAYLIKGDRLALVDTGPKTDEAWAALNKQLADLGYAPDDIEMAVLTHDHPDHAGLLDYFPQTLDVHGHRLNERWINRTDEFLTMHDRFYLGLFDEFGIPESFHRLAGQLKKSLKFSCNRSLTGELSEGDTLPGLEDWRVIETPGHAQSHVSLYREKDGVLLAGDHVLAHISPNPLLEPPINEGEERPMPQLQYNHSLAKLRDYPIGLVYTGHGTEVSKLPELIERRLTRQHERAMSVKEMLKDGPKTVFDLCRQLFPAAFERELGLTLSETAGQLDYLQSLGEIEFSFESKTKYYRVR
ncbi:MBL fold metallo-hydrolase [Neobacillus notoginsengisoli]|uniref:MBL fold metallo-hydrolase n=1 Tax=Neobacillus notoginsengisoli TaxID=1578198 RepID=A0A417YVD2_9BACI|nr:MBL fold metallo-hydrolase [Neobacillus notoginsengisoli]RHW41155.1 MBL fold metallo-hydrolase [Neobacillus notoginsengisoli]